MEGIVRTPYFSLAAAKDRGDKLINQNNFAIFAEK
jgi:hypothetical protein